MIQAPLRSAFEETRALATGLGLPVLEHLSLSDTLVKVVRAHERRTDTTVALITDDLPNQVALPTKITLYRLIQEALNNAYHHAGGAGQQVRVQRDGDGLNVEVLDTGRGFDLSRPMDWDGHLGLAGMRERVESLGGLFQIESAAGVGTRVTARLVL
jgi:signal transduction histidine kinase